MLDLIEQELIKEKYSYLKLTGKTKNRKEVVEAFQSHQANIFLISLKAGGTGLNLTAADTVIHYDPWWNPSAENQATDRGHRIGQQNQVFVYKLVMEKTIEEKIITLQKKKHSLVHNLYAGTGTKKNSFSKADLEELFQPY